MQPLSFFRGPPIESGRQKQKLFQKTKRNKNKAVKNKNSSIIKRPTTPVLLIPREGQKGRIEKRSFFPRLYSSGSSLKPELLQEESYRKNRLPVSVTKKKFSAGCRRQESRPRARGLAGNRPLGLEGPRRILRKLSLVLPK